MILVGNQRGGSRQLSNHLLKDENDHVEVHELRGFVASDLRGALDEIYALSRATKASQYMFSLSLNPPLSARVKIEEFEAAIDRIENELGLSGMPRAIVFHEKQGRRHAHCVWSRIKPDEMKAVQLSFTHKNLMRIGRELFIEYGWQMPRGLAQSGNADPRNFSLNQWQQAKRQSKDPRAIKMALQDAWAISDTKASFEHALQDRGFWLAKGDRRGFVTIDAHGEVYSLSKWTGVKSKALKERLGEEEDLDSVDEVRQRIAAEMTEATNRLRAELLVKLRTENHSLHKQRREMLDRHRAARKELSEKIEERKWQEARERQSRFRKGLHGLWDWMRGENLRLKKLNEAEAAQAEVRDRAATDELIFTQMDERQRLVDLRQELAREFGATRRDLESDLRGYRGMRGLQREQNRQTRELRR